MYFIIIFWTTLSVVYLMLVQLTSVQLSWKCHCLEKNDDTETLNKVFPFIDKKKQDRHFLNYYPLKMKHPFSIMTLMSSLNCFKEPYKIVLNYAVLWKNAEIKRENHLGSKIKFQKLSVRKNRLWNALEKYQMLRIKHISWTLAEKQFLLLKKPFVINF